MADNRTFTVKSNAKRGAERLLATGGAPATAYTIRTRDDGLFEIVWLTASPGLAMAAWPAPTTEELAATPGAKTGRHPTSAEPAPAEAGAPAQGAQRRGVSRAQSAAQYAAPVAPGAMPEKPG